MEMERTMKNLPDKIYLTDGGDPDQYTTMWSQDRITEDDEVYVKQRPFVALYIRLSHLDEFFSRGPEGAMERVMCDLWQAVKEAVES
jgi:hypothetical protein